MLYYRQKVILALIEAFGGKLERTKFQKLMFLFTQDQKEKSFSFIPYRFGCFSFQTYKDKNYLIENDYLENQEQWQLKDSKNNYISDLKKTDINVLQKIKKDFLNCNSDELIKFVYLNYPYYTINSTIKEKILTESEIHNIEILFNYQNQTDYKLFTIGYEGKTIEEYLNLLIKNNIKTLCDVRKNPVSRKYGFSKGTLSEILEKIDIKYVHIPELGINSSQRKDLNSPDSYKKLFKNYRNTLHTKSLYLEKLYDLFISEKRVALTCFEKDPEMCHRNEILSYIIKLPQFNFEYENL